MRQACVTVPGPSFAPVPFAAPTPTRTGGAVRADALPSALAGAPEYSVYAWARVDAVNGAEMPAVSTGPGSGSGAGYGWGGEERLHSLVQQVALLVTVART